MISNIQLGALIFNLILYTLVILIPFFIFKQNRKSLMKGLLFGFIISIFAEIVLRTQVLNYLQTNLPFISNNPVIFALIMGLVSTFIVLGSRAFVLGGVGKNFMEENKEKSGIYLGWGQAATEAFFLSVQLMTTFSLALRINQNTIYELVSEQLTKATIDKYISELVAIPWFNYVAAGFSLIFISFIYILISDGIVKVLSHKNNRWQLLANLTMYVFAYYFSYAIATFKQTTNLYALLINVIFGSLALFYIKKQHEKSI